jgi:hypothetical protein
MSWASIGAGQFAVIARNIKAASGHAAAAPPSIAMNGGIEGRPPVYWLRKIFRSC